MVKIEGLLQLINVVANLVMIAHGKINRWIVGIVFEEPLEDRNCLKFKISNHVFSFTFSIVWNVPNLIKGSSHMSKVSYIKGWGLVDSSLSYYVWMGF